MEDANIWQFFARFHSLQIHFQITLRNTQYTLGTDREKIKQSKGYNEMNAMQ